MFFNQWKILFGEVCGYDVENLSDKLIILVTSSGNRNYVRTAFLALRGTEGTPKMPIEWTRDSFVR
jgi:hypothetical protein